MDEKNNVNDTVTSNNKTMEYYNNVTKSIINQTTTDVDPDINIEKEAFFLAKKAEKKLEKKVAFVHYQRQLIYLKRQVINIDCAISGKEQDYVMKTVL